MSFEMKYTPILDIDSVARYAVEYCNEDDSYEQIAQDYLDDNTMHYCDCFQIFYEVWDGSNFTCDDFDLAQFARRELEKKLDIWKPHVLDRIKELREERSKTGGLK